MASVDSTSPVDSSASLDVGSVYNKSEPFHLLSDGVRYEAFQMLEGMVLKRLALTGAIEYQFIPLVDEKHLERLRKIALMHLLEKIVQILHGTSPHLIVNLFFESKLTIGIIDNRLLFEGARVFRDTTTPKIYEENAHLDDHLMHALEWALEEVSNFDPSHLNAHAQEVLMQLKNIVEIYQAYFEVIFKNPSGLLWIADHIHPDHSYRITAEDLKTAPFFSNLNEVEANLLALRVKTAILETDFDIESLEITEAFKQYNKTHRIFKFDDWYALAIACYMKGHLTIGEIAALSQLASLEYEDNPVEIIDMESTAGKQLMLEAIGQRFCIHGATQEQTYETLMAICADLSPVERKLIVVKPKESSAMSPTKAATQFVEYTEFFHVTYFSIICAPNVIQRLLELRFDKHAIKLNLKASRPKGSASLVTDDSRIILIVVPGVYTTEVHDTYYSSPLEVFAHDICHAYIGSAIAHKHRKAFLEIANVFQKEFQLADKAYQKVKDDPEVENKYVLVWKKQAQNMKNLRDLFLDLDFSLYARPDTLRLYFGDHKLSPGEIFWASIMLIRLKLYGSIEHKGFELASIEEDEGIEQHFLEIVCLIKEHISANKVKFQQKYGINLEDIHSMKIKIKITNPAIQEQVSLCAIAL